MTTSTDPRRPSPTTSRRADPEAWAQALELADGDPRRLLVDDDGRTVHVLNRPR